MTEESEIESGKSASGGHWPRIEVPPNSSCVVGRSDAAHVVIKHASISRQHVRLSNDRGQIVLEDLDSRFGTFINEARVQKRVLRAGDVVRFGSSPPYRFDGERLAILVDASPMRLSLAGLSVRRGRRTLLKDVTLSIPSGSFVGILGPSGSGKSLLLGCLSSTISPSEGTICFDDAIPVRSRLDYFRSKIGIVTQDDLVYTSLTVAENLRLAARTRIPSLAKAEESRLVESVLKSVGMLDHQNKLVGVLSGGQRKRVSVAIELLTHPRLLLLDEPTSGLDPGMQARLMDILRGLTRQGITVVCSTHTMDSMQLLDQIVVLGLSSGVGTLVFDGRPDELLTRFRVQTPADLFDRLQEIHHDFISPAPDDSGRQANRAPPEQGTGTSRSPRVQIAPQKPREEASYFATQTAVTLERSFLNLWRDRTSTVFTIIQPVVLAALVVISQHNRGPTIFLHFFLVVSSLWLGMTGSVREMVRERQLYVRDRLAGLCPEAYLAGKLLFAILLSAIQAFVLYGIARLLIGWVSVNPLAQDSFLKNSFVLGIGIVFLGGAGGSIIGLVVSSLASSERVAISILPLVLLPLMLLSRVAYGSDDMNFPWAESSPVGAIAKIPEFVHTHLDGVKTVVLLASFPILTRPATAVLDMPANQISFREYQVAEWLHLTLILLIYLLLLYLVFRRVERNWQQLR